MAKEITAWLGTLGLDKYSQAFAEAKSKQKRALKTVGAPMAHGAATQESAHHRQSKESTAAERRGGRVGRAPDLMGGGLLGRGSASAT